MSVLDPSIDSQGRSIHQDRILMPSTSLSASTAISVTNFAGRGAIFFMNITSAFPGSSSSTVALKVKIVQPNALLSAVTIAACTPTSVSGVSVLVCYPGALRSSTAPSVSTNAALYVMGCPLPANFSVVASFSSGATSKEVVMSLGMTTIY